MEETNGSVNFEIGLVGVGTPVLQATSNLTWGRLGNPSTGVRISQENKKSRGQTAELEISTLWGMGREQTGHQKRWKSPFRKTGLRGKSAFYRNTHAESHPVSLPHKALVP